MEKVLKRSLDESIEWIIKTKREIGGSAAQFSLFNGWSNPYPETTGYIIPTLLNYGNSHNNDTSIQIAVDFGEWLLEIQSDLGYWNGGLHPPKKENPSIFNTGQILFGMHALYEYTRDKKWLEAGFKGGEWLADGVGKSGLWDDGHYNDFNPTYYTRVAWPMLIMGKATNNDIIKNKAIAVLDTLLQRKHESGTFDGWEFSTGKPAFTHTISYTVRGFIESSLILEDWERYGKPLEKTMNKLYRMAELNNGRLAGAYYKDWKPVKYYTCLTGNAQVALGLLRRHQYNPDLRLVNAGSKLIEFVCNAQSKGRIIKSTKGAIAGSKPLWGRYIMFRYPNWAAKFYADSIMLLSEVMKKEKSFERT